jgi:hypothetical protein
LRTGRVGRRNVAPKTSPIPVTKAGVAITHQRGRRRLRRRGIAAIVAFSLLAVLLVRHAKATITDNGHSTVVEQITRAILQRDLRPVLTKFSLNGASGLSDDVRLGAIADRLNSLGALRDVRFAGNGASADTQKFIATFAHGSVSEEVSFDGNRVVGFTLTPVSGE